MAIGKVVVGDCRAVMDGAGPFDLLIADPPYGDTSLDWDEKVRGWEITARKMLKPSGSMWVFGSMRFVLDQAIEMRAAGLKYAQDLVWEKHNGSGMAADRFRRVHEHIVQFYRSDAKWSEVYNDVPRLAGTAKPPPRRKRPTHFGRADQAAIPSLSPKPRLMRSVIEMRSCHGRAIHPTEKPDALLEILIRASCPDGGLVGDLFAGSGAAGEAALRSGRRYFGAEIDPDMAAKANVRLASVLPIRAAAE